MKLCGIHHITGIIRLRTGLHIGAGNDSMEAGCLVKPIIRNPITRAPYIPGSSLKGKMRSLLETEIFAPKRPETARYVRQGQPCACGMPDCAICALFGARKSPEDRGPDLGPTRMLARDAFLVDEDNRKFREGCLPMEIKYGANPVDRRAGHPRAVECVPAGVRFNLDIGLKVYNDDDALYEWVFMGLKLVQMNTLGGCSRQGCGHIQFEDLKIDNIPWNLEDTSI